MTEGSWRCPLCKALAEDARTHLADVHGVGGGADRFGLREAARPERRQPSRRPPDSEGSEDDPPPVSPPVWRRVAPPRDRDGHGSSSLEGWTWTPGRRPRRAPRPPAEPPEMAPAKPPPLPPDAAVLRLICETLEGVDASVLRDRLLELPGVESVALDLYEGTVDLYLDRARASVRHLVAMASSRIRLRVRTAELHRAAERGQRLGEATRIYVVQ